MSITADYIRENILKLENDIKVLLSKKSTAIETSSACAVEIENKVRSIDILNLELEAINNLYKK